MTYTKKIDTLLEYAASLRFAEQDFAELALAAADQAGASVEEQKRIAHELDVNTWEAVRKARAQYAEHMAKQLEMVGA